MVKMRDCPDFVRPDDRGAPAPEVEAAQVGHKPHQHDDRGCVDSYVQPTRMVNQCD